MIMFLRTPLLCLPTGLISLAAANVEKTIFLGPEPVNVPQQPPSLADLRLDVLTPDHYARRTHVGAVFPTSELPRGTDTWLVLDDLEEDRRYEVRICWAATVSPSSRASTHLISHHVIKHYEDWLTTTAHPQQPTAFHLDTYTLDHVFDTPELITSLYNYSASRQEKQSDPSGNKPSVVDPSKIWGTDAARGSSSSSSSAGRERQASVLFLRVSAAAEYFTTNRMLMLRPEPVLVDVILDPFVLNVLPRTLVPTVCYIVLVAAVSWVVATRLVMPWLRGIMIASAEASGEEAEKKTR